MAWLIMIGEWWEEKRKLLDALWGCVYLNEAQVFPLSETL